MIKRLSDLVTRRGDRPDLAVLAPALVGALCLRRDKAVKCFSGLFDIHCLDQERTKKTELTTKFEEETPHLDWDETYKELVSFKNQNEISNAAKQDARLRNWLINQQIKKRRGRLSKEKIQRLEELGFVWDTSEHQWETQFEKLLYYKQRYGDCLIPRSFEDRTLSLWVITQRRLRKSGGLRDDRIQRLTDLGFVWDTSEHQWETQFQKLLYYKQRYGDCLVPRSFEDRSLFLWVIKQRRSRKSGELRDDRIQRLVDLGFVWDTSEHQRETQFENLQDYRQEYSDSYENTGEENPENGQELIKFFESFCDQTPTSQRYFVFSNELENLVTACEKSMEGQAHLAIEQIFEMNLMLFLVEGIRILTKPEQEQVIILLSGISSLVDEKSSDLFLMAIEDFANRFEALGESVSKSLSTLMREAFEDTDTNQKLLVSNIDAELCAIPETFTENVYTYTSSGNHSLLIRLGKRISGNPLTNWILTSSDGENIPSERFQNKKGSPILFDKVIGHFNDLKSVEWSTENKSQSLERLLGEYLQGVRNLLTEKGKAVIAVPRLFLSQSQLIRKIIEGGYLKQIVDLPKVNNDSQKDTILLVLTKGPSSGEFPLWIDATAALKRTFVDQAIDDLDESAISFKEDTEVCKIYPLSKDYLQSQNYLIDPEDFRLHSQYTVDKDGNPFVRLSEVLKPIAITSDRSEDPLKIRIIERSSIRASVETRVLPFENTLAVTRSEVADKDFPQYTIKEECLLLDCVLSEQRLQGCRFIPDDPQILISRFVKPFAFDPAKVDPDWLLDALSHERVKLQTDELLKGSTAIQILHVSKIGKIRIVLPPLSQQKAIVTAVEEEKRKAVVQALGFEEIIKRREEEIYTEFEDRQHAFNNDVANVVDLLGSLKKKLENEGQIDKDSVLVRRTNKTALGAFIEAEKSALVIKKLVEALTEREPLKTPEIMNLEDEIKTWTDSRTKEGLTIILSGSLEIEDYANDTEELTEDELVEPVNPIQINLHRDDFHNALDLILQNAEEHGFTDDQQWLLKLTLDTHSEAGVAILSISNNGKPFRHGVNKDVYTARGKTTGEGNHSGIGGSRVKQIVEHAKGSLDVINEPNSDFPVTIVLKIPTC
ncbi:Helicase associated domain protein [Akkermansiaceae bacterium]|nr:Helicase associated domain protein [Akkermansiaceae bacterium]